MVFILLDRAALQEALDLAMRLEAHVWLGAESLTEQEHKAFCSSGHRITRFSYELSGAGREVVEDALSTVREHHPGEIMWVKHAE